MTAKILIADGHYPASTKRGPNAELISLNLAPGVVTCSQVLRALLSAVPHPGAVPDSDRAVRTGVGHRRLNPAVHAQLTFQKAGHVAGAARAAAA